MNARNPWLWLVLSLVGATGLALLGPPERTLGPNIRTVYLHGAWVWAALLGFAVAGGLGVLAWLTRRTRWHAWSRAWGRAALLFWWLYLPLSLLATQTNWNGLFLAEPRWRVALTYAIAGLLLQLGLTLTPPAWASAANALYILALIWSLTHTEQVMHPPAPMFNSRAWLIQATFFATTALLVIAIVQTARLWGKLEPDLRPEPTP